MKKRNGKKKKDRERCIYMENIRKRNKKKKKKSKDTKEIYEYMRE